MKNDSKNKPIGDFEKALRKQKQPCDLCENLEKGDTLYSYSSWDGGIGFDYINDIRYCPKCGRALTEYD